MKITITVLMFFAVGAVAGRGASAQTVVGPPGAPPPPSSGPPALAVPGTPLSGPTLSVLGGVSMFSLVAQVELAYGGAVLAVGGGGGGGAAAFGPSLQASAGYRIRLGGSRWAIQLGARFSAMWGQADGCADVCRFDFYAGEVAIRYVGRDGFTFHAGLPLVAWVPVGPDAGETKPRLEGYVLNPEVISLLQTVMIGWSHAF